ncbi:helix-turn-helix domain-containing protein [Guptibacillus algicola]|uniref:helix-turn-helix domain-containing protein n=1 Tax=Guptibacillus algicola TaxID=225844 RepID=UPI001CD5795D|nr:helix-turn-helix domain-containing protein [Alkalihalobacillus algicola]MCA0988175.1 helix-turn-helix transcriptional regulator [Alkalihalobacillus algicola]
MRQDTLGTSLRELRMYLGLSQSDLSNGICTQALISQIENNDVSPSAELLYHLASRLGVDINYFFHMIETPRLDYVKEVCRQIRRHIKNREYHTVAEILADEEDNPLFSTIKNRQFVLWHKAICHYYIEHDAHSSFQLLNDALLLTATTSKNYSEREIEILISTAILYSEENNWYNALPLFKKAFYHVRFYPIINDETIEIRLYYNYSRALSSSGDYDKALSIAKEGVQICREKQRFYLFGELTFQCGKLNHLLGNQDLAKTYLKTASTIFQLDDNIPYKNHVDTFAKKVES